MREKIACVYQERKNIISDKSELSTGVEIISRAQAEKMTVRRDDVPEASLVIFLKELSVFSYYTSLSGLHNYGLFSGIL